MGELLTVINETAVSEEKAVSIESAFLPLLSKAKEWKEKAESLIVTSVDQVEEMKQAREARLILKGIRGDVEKKRKALKENIVREGKAIDGVSNIIKALIVPIEEHLEQQEKFAEIQEQKKKAELKASRIEELSKYNVETGFYNLDDMPDETYQTLLETSIFTFNKKKEEAEKAEKERIEAERIQVTGLNRQNNLYKYAQFHDVKTVFELGKLGDDEYNNLEAELKAKKAAYDQEQERIRLENDRLKKEAEVREARNKELRPYIIFIRDYDALISLPEDEYKSQLSDIKKGAKDYWEFERKEKEENDKKMREEQEKRERAEAEIRRKQEAEEKAKREEEARINAEEDRKAEEARQAALAPDKDKLQKLASEISAVKFPELESDTAKQVSAQALQMLNRAVSYIKNQSINL